MSKLANPVVLTLVLMLGALAWNSRPRLGKGCLWAAFLVLLLGSNEWVVRLLAIPLERQIHAPATIPSADAVVVLGGAVESHEWPRRTVEVSESGDRVLYARELFRQGKAPLILCAGGGRQRSEVGGQRSALPNSELRTPNSDSALPNSELRSPNSERPLSDRPSESESEQMKTLLVSLGVPAEVILVETNSSNTLENAVNSRPLIQKHGLKHLLLVTSAVHTPRAVRVFRKQFPGIRITPAPTDYMFTQGRRMSIPEMLKSLIPSSQDLMRLDQTLHEYLGLVYYQLRGRL